MSSSSGDIVAAAILSKALYDLNVADTVAYTVDNTPSVEQGTEPGLTPYGHVQAALMVPLLKLAGTRDRAIELRGALVDCDHDVAHALSALLPTWQYADVHNPDHPMYVAPDAPHWHVRRHGEDDDVQAFASVFDALGSAADELAHIAEHERDSAAGVAEAGDPGEAYACVVRADRWYNLADNAGNLYRQASGPRSGRAARYSLPEEADNRGFLLIASQWGVSAINEDGPRGFAVYDCSESECAPADED